MVLLSAAPGSSDPPLPVMVIIAMLCLLLPYLIRLKTGKSVTEWLSFSGLRDRIWSKLPWGRNDPSVKKESSARQIQEKNQTKQDTKQQLRKSASNGLMHFVSDVIRFTRRRKLFAILPGNVACGGETAELTMLVITKARIIGVLCYASTGTVHCRRDRGIWKETRGGETVSIGSPVAKAEEQTRIVKRALAGKGLGDTPYETVVVFTGAAVELTGEKPPYVYEADRFLKSLETTGDLETGKLVPKEIGAVCNSMRPKNEKKK